MKLFIKSGDTLSKCLTVNYSVDELTEKVEKFLPRIETQLCVSIDYLVRNDEAILMCDSGIRPMLFEFICEIVKKELKN